MFRKLKKTVLLLLIILLFSCTPKGDRRGTDLIGKSHEKYKIVTIVKVIGNAWFGRMREGIYRFAKESGMDCSLIGPVRADGALQAELVEKAVRDGADAICIVPFDVDAVEPALQKAREQGIVVIAHEASSIRNADYIIEAFDNEAYGIHLMDHLASFMDYKGEYLVLVGSYGSRTHMEWMGAAVERQRVQFPQMSVYGDWIESFDDPSLIYKKINEAVRVNHNIRGILGAPMSTAKGAGLALEEKGLSDRISLVSTSLVSVSSDELEKGSVDLISFWDPADTGYIMNLMAALTLEKKEIREGMDLFVPGYREIRVDPFKKNLFYGAAWTDVTKENMGDYAF